MPRAVPSLPRPGGSLSSGVWLPTSWKSEVTLPPPPFLSFLDQLFIDRGPSHPPHRAGGLQCHPVCDSAGPRTHFPPKNPGERGVRPQAGSPTPASPVSRLTSINTDDEKTAGKTTILRLDRTHTQSHSVGNQGVPRGPFLLIAKGGPGKGRVRRKGGGWAVAWSADGRVDLGAWGLPRL